MARICSLAVLQVALTLGRLPQYLRENWGRWEVEYKEVLTQHGLCRNEPAHAQRRLPILHMLRKGCVLHMLRYSITLHMLREGYVLHMHDHAQRKHAY